MFNTMGIHHSHSEGFTNFHLVNLDLFHFGRKIPSPMGIHHLVAVKVLFWLQNSKTVFFSSQYLAKLGKPSVKKIVPN